jgi:hypothetical protein
MSIRFDCPQCRKTYSVADHLAGKRAQCPGCKQVLMIPEPKPTPRAQPADIEALAAEALADQPPPEPETPATIEFNCYYCDEKISISAELAGKRAPCPECRRIIKVPELEKKGPKDWRKMDSRLPSGARRDEQAPEGTWESRSVSTVSRQSLVEAAALPQVKKKLTWQQWAKRGAGGAAGVAGLALVVWLGMTYLRGNREKQALTQTVQYLTTEDKVPLAAAAEVQRGLGEYYLRAGNATEAKRQLEGARKAATSADKASPAERDLILRDIALVQANLGGDRADKIKGTHLSWDDAQKEIRQTLQGLTTPQGRTEAVRAVTRRLCERGQPTQAVPLATLFPEQQTELRGVIGLELLHAKQDQLAQENAQRATEDLANRSQGAQPAKPGALIPPASLLALWVALGKPEQAAALAPPPTAPDKVTDVDIRVGYAEGLARQDKWELARSLARGAIIPQDRLRGLVALAAVAADDGQASSSPDLDDAIKLAETEGERLGEPWLLLRLVQLAVPAGKAEHVQPVIRFINEPALRGRAQVEVLKARLVTTRGPVGDAGLSGWEKEIAPTAFGLAIEAIARHDSQAGAAATVQRWSEQFPEWARPFATLGIALGLQDEK